MLKLTLLVCALVSLTYLAAPAHGQGYAVLVSYLNGTNCTSTSHVSNQYYRLGQCSFGFMNTYDSANPNVVQIGQYSTKGCTGTVNQYQKTLKQCTAGDSTDYYWDYVADPSTMEATANEVTYTVYGKSTTAKCNNPVEYVIQQDPICYSNNGQPTKTSCSGTQKTTLTCVAGDTTCSGTCSTAHDTLNDSCQLDSDGYYYSTSCGSSKAGTTQAPKTTSATTATTSSNTNSNTGATTSSNTGVTTNTNTGVTTSSSSNTNSNSNSGATTSSASTLSASLFLLVAPLAAYLL